MLSNKRIRTNFSTSVCTFSLLTTNRRRQFGHVTFLATARLLGHMVEFRMSAIRHCLWNRCPQWRAITASSSMSKHILHFHLARCSPSVSSGTQIGLSLRSVVSLLRRAGDIEYFYPTWRWTKRTFDRARTPALLSVPWSTGMLNVLYHSLES